MPIWLIKNPGEETFNFTELQPMTYNGELILALGSLDVEVEYELQTASVLLIAVKGTGPKLLGQNWMSTIWLNWSNIYQVMTNTSFDNKCPNIFKDDLGLQQQRPVSMSVTKILHVLYFLKEELHTIQEQSSNYQC